MYEFPVIASAEFPTAEQDANGSGEMDCSIPEIHRNFQGTSSEISTDKDQSDISRKNGYTKFHILIENDFILLAQYNCVYTWQLPMRKEFHLSVPFRKGKKA